MTEATDRNDDTPIWGAERIGAEINRSARQAFHMLQNKMLPGKKVGGIWVSTPRKLREAVTPE
jgi:hypothetical protein